MALRVWLPLNGTLDNIGISDVTVTNNGATVDNNGKIGKCYSFDGTDDGIKVTMPSGMTSLKNCSIALGGMGNNSFGGISHDGGATLATCTMFDGRWQLANGSWTYINGGTRSTTAWHHFAITISEDTITTYYDGAQITSTALASNIVTNITSSNFIEIGCDHPGGDEYGTIKVNDFRIYNHCLSPKEVKEISQGLILHYKLDGWSGGSGENLLANSMPLNSLSGWSSAGTNGSNSIVDCDITSSGKCVRCTYTGTTQVSGGIHHPAIDGNSMEDGEIYTLSAYLRASKSCTITFKNEMMSSASSGTFTPTITQSGQRYEVSGPINKAATYHSNVMYVVTSAAEQNMGIEACMVKLEKGSTSTAGALTPSEFGVNSTKITDSSGYGNDGIITGTLETNASNRYLVSTKFPTNTCHIKLPEITYSNFGNSYTFSGGEYITTVSGGPMPWGFSNGNRLNCYHTTNLCGNTGDGGSNPFTPTKTAASLIDNKWHHMVITGDGAATQLYIDGVNVGKATTYKALTGTQIYISGGDTGTSYKMTNNSMSDFRIYATALSAEDILDLYHTPANIDNLQNIHAFELKEQSGNMFAGSPMTGTVTGDATNNYYTITSNPSTSTWGIGPAVGTSPKKIIPGGMSYILTYEVYSPTAAQWYIDYNNNDPTTSLSGNDNDTGRLRTGVNVPANTGTLITYGCSNTNETKNPDHLPLYDYSTGLGPVMTNISSAITWHMRNPQGYLVDADNKEHIYESGVFQANFIKEDNQSLYTSFRNEEKAAGAHGYIEK